MRRRSFVWGLAGAVAGVGLASPLTAAHAVAAGRRSAQGWQAFPAPAAKDGARLYGVAAPSASCAWAVGAQAMGTSTQGTPLALHWDGSAWSLTDLSHLSFAGNLRAVAGDERAAWAIGHDSTAGYGRLFTWDGRTWREVAYPGRGETGTTLTDVAVAPDGRVWVTGRHGDRAALLRFNGTTWGWCPPVPDEPGKPTPTPYGVRVAPGGAVWVFGEIVARWDGEWTVLSRSMGIRASASGLLPVADDDVWLTGYGYGVGGPPGKPPGVIFQHFDGAQWTNVQAPFSVGMLTSITGDAQGRPDRITGWDFWDQKRAHYLRWDGTSWVSERGPLVPDASPLMTEVVPIPGTSGYWAVGTTSFYSGPGGRIHIERYA